MSDLMVKRILAQSAFDVVDGCSTRRANAMDVHARPQVSECTVPLCRAHYREIHRHGDETAWWRDARIDPTMTARAL